MGSLVVDFHSQTGIGQLDPNDQYDLTTQYLDLEGVAKTKIEDRSDTFLQKKIEKISHPKVQEYSDLARKYACHEHLEMQQV